MPSDPSFYPPLRESGPCAKCQGTGKVTAYHGVSIALRLCSCKWGRTPGMVAETVIHPEDWAWFLQKHGNMV